MYEDGFGIFLVFFLSESILFNPVKNIGGKNTFCRFLKNTILSQKSDALNKFLVKFTF